MVAELVGKHVKPSYGESDNVIDMSHIDLKEISDVKRYYSLLKELSTITGRPILLPTQMNMHIPVFDITTYYQADDLVEYNGQVYVCDKPDVIGNFNRYDWHHAIVDLRIESAVGLDSTCPIRYEIRCLLVPDDFTIMSFSQPSEGLCAESVITAVQDISDKFSVRTVYLSKFGTSYIHSMLSKMGYHVLYG